MGLLKTRAIKLLTRDNRNQSKTRAGHKLCEKVFLLFSILRSRALENFKKFVVFLPPQRSSVRRYRSNALFDVWKYPVCGCTKTTLLSFLFVFIINIFRFGRTLSSIKFSLMFVKLFMWANKKSSKIFFTLLSLGKSLYFAKKSQIMSIAAGSSVSFWKAPLSSTSRNQMTCFCYFRFTSQLHSV